MNNDWTMLCRSEPWTSEVHCVGLWGHFNKKRKILIDWYAILSLSLNRLSLSSWLNKLNKPTLKDNTVSYPFTLFTFGGPCHLSSFKQWSRGPHFPLRKGRLVLSVMGTISIAVNRNLINFVHFFKTTKRPFTYILYKTRCFGISGNNHW